MLTLAVARSAGVLPDRTNSMNSTARKRCIPDIVRANSRLEHLGIVASPSVVRVEERRVVGLVDVVPLLIGGK